MFSVIDSGRRHGFSVMIREFHSMTSLFVEVIGAIRFQLSRDASSIRPYSVSDLRKDGRTSAVRSAFPAKPEAGGSMCDYSLAEVRNRLAVEGEELVVHRFSTHS